VNDEPMGIYRGEVYAIMAALAQLVHDVRIVLAILGWEDDEETEADA
jgi:hypothetical protein